MIVEEPLSNNDAAARWKLLRDRLVETLSRGFTVARLATETGLMAAQVEACRLLPIVLLQAPVCQHWGRSSRSSGIDACAVLSEQTLIGGNVATVRRIVNGIGSGP